MNGLATSIADIVDLIHPTPSGIGIVCADQVWVLFDREIDENTISAGNFFVTGPDNDTWSGPDLQMFLDAPEIGDEDEVLQSPGYTGLVTGEFTFKRIALDSLDEVSTLDTTGSGFLYRTKAIFTPANRLQADTTYEAFLSGDEVSDETITGISERTVFDTVASGTNTGLVDMYLSGGYTGTIDDTYWVQITTAGDVGTSKFIFWHDYDPGTTYGPFRTRRSGVALDEDVTAHFPEGAYVVDDIWSTVVKAPVTVSGNLAWPFKTGSGSIETLPTTASTSVIGSPIEGATPGVDPATSFDLIDTYPADTASNLTIPAGEFEITLTFGSNVDAATVASGLTVTAFLESVTGEMDIGGQLIADPTVEGSVITLVVASGYLADNSLVTVTVDSTVAGTNGIDLGTDHTFWFTTRYSPLYCTSRRLKLLVGAFISDLPEDTINLAIHMASLEADMLTWNQDRDDENYYSFVRSQWTCCRTAEILLTNVLGGATQKKSKRLGDLEVSYNPTSDVAIPLKKAEECRAKWEGALLAGGRQVQTPLMTIKGAWDPDRPPVGRNWAHVREVGNSENPFANMKSPSVGSRRYFTHNSVRRGWWNRD